MRKLVLLRLCLCTRGPAFAAVIALGAVTARVFALMPIASVSEAREGTVYRCEA
jgi:hypothetical protein